MKKILSLALAAGLAMGVVGCNEKGNSNLGEAQPLVDTVSMEMGEYLGHGWASQLSQDSTLNKEEVLKGILAILKADTSNTSYMAGIQLGMQIAGTMDRIKQQLGADLNRDLFIEKFVKGFKSDSVMPQEMMMLKEQELSSLMERANAKIKEADPVAKKNKDAGEAFSKKKAADKAYSKTPSGIMYRVITEGEGENFKETDIIMTNYVGKHIDGKVFDSNEGRDAVPFSCQGVIKGFAEMLQLMKPGMKVEVVIPAELAYGANGQKGPDGNYVIEPNETLVFELETVGLQDLAAAGKNAPIPVPTEDPSKKK